MSLWSDQEIRKLNAKAKEFEERIAALESGKRTVSFGMQTPTPEPADKRTKEWREWKTANS